MFFAASIALTSVLWFLAVRSAPLALREDSGLLPGDVTPFACSGLNGTGDCVPLNSRPGGAGIDPLACTNLDFEPKSLVLNLDNVCGSFLTADCEIDFNNSDELFPSTSDNLRPGIKSITCEFDEGLVDGLFPDRK
ncbi:hypothetical protein C8R43DRAFT_1039403 [Mycena crocata]|nr:hypothetical protein C8R43DRAFT_1039403 [Mycena crocata]